jgi:CelD/BcsL family acetyltransferase involved in cellulose biosynthesis
VGVSGLPATWLALEGAGPPADELVGPFPLPAFISSWWSHLGVGEPLIVESGRSKLALTLKTDLLQIAGDSDLTDYHSPLGDDVEALGVALGELARDKHRISLDSLPEGSATRLVTGLASTGVKVTSQPDVGVRVLELSKGARFLSTLDKRQRHEVERKRRRYQDLLGDIDVETDSDGAFQRFAALHRGSGGHKGRFMVDEREHFFEDLDRQDGWRVDELFSGGRSVAAMFGYSDGATYYLYNSAYDNGLAGASPGIVLLTHMIERLADEGFTRFDFLKGDEEYKTRLGAFRRQLYRIET